MPSDPCLYNFYLSRAADRELRRQLAILDIDEVVFVRDALSALYGLRNTLIVRKGVPVWARNSVLTVVPTPMLLRGLAGMESGRLGMAQAFIEDANAEPYRMLEIDLEVTDDSHLGILSNHFSVDCQTIFLSAVQYLIGVGDVIARVGQPGRLYVGYDLPRLGPKLWLPDYYTH